MKAVACCQPNIVCQWFIICIIELKFAKHACLNNETTGITLVEALNEPWIGLDSTSDNLVGSLTTWIILIWEWRTFSLNQGDLKSLDIGVIP